MSHHATQLDHVIILLPYKDILNPPPWITNHFTVSPGGKHADNKTENRLILFSDGTYVELIAFINDDPEKRKGHWWDKPFGIVDFALTTQKPFDFAGLQERLEGSGSGVAYAKPVAGSRRREDGQDVKWEVTFPLGAERGEVPFWCHDVTPRERRVPVGEENTDHPCQAIGMSRVTIEVRPGSVERLGSALSAITEARRDDVHGYPVGSAISSEGEEADSWIALQPIDEGGAGHQLRLTLRLPRDGKRGLDCIEERVGDGTVFIGFEQ
ncbi:hypothetical protein B0A55_01858 [Friedmanniomyces simplex]|uniref:Glyoxalase-like domain-containing protein n=1 Tax=Friedmanniomyces simplex TaxID=329884 RepID=A0A4U0XV98_9PEZI|nr:hypothetical protein B0A55_01858 [Friedmanniomyces simplex]